MERRAGGRLRLVSLAAVLLASCRTLADNKPADIIAALTPCSEQRHIVCDPDDFLPTEEHGPVASVLADIAGAVPPYGPAACHSQKSEGNEIAVVLVRSKALPQDVTQQYSAQKVADELRRTWQVGGKTCDDGALLLFIPDMGRVFTSIGAGMAAVIHRKQLQLIIRQMEDLLKEGKTALAVHLGVDSLGLALRNQTAEATGWRKDRIALLVAALAVGALLLYCGRRVIVRRGLRPGYGAVRST